MLNRQVEQSLAGSSVVRRMFEEANRLRGEAGGGEVCDFSLGNPHLEPPPELVRRLAELTAAPPPGLHRYMPTAGFPESRAKMAEAFSRWEETHCPASNVVMTAGAACGLNIVFRTLLNPGDEVVCFAPLFPEYRFYVMHAGGACRVVETSDTFDLVPELLATALSPATRVVLVNSPNNPTGRVYSAETIRELTQVLAQANRRRDVPIVLVSDEPYRRLVYGPPVPSLWKHYPHTISVGSFSKDLGLAGSRIGFVAVHPECADAAALVEGLIFCLRTLGFVNASALYQLAVVDCLESSVDIAAYQRNRDLLAGGLARIGYDCRVPEGAFFLFPRTPIADDGVFCRRLAEQRVVAVPGSGFGRPGYMRLSYAVEPRVIESALPRFERVFHTHGETISHR